MRQFVMILFLSSCLIFSCHSNKKGGHRAHGKKKGRHSSVASSGGGSSSTTNSNGGNISKIDSASAKNKKTRFGEGRPKINSGGVSGIGSGGSYASNSYRRDVLNKDSPSTRKKEYFKKRMEESDRMYYGEDVKEEMPSAIQDDTTSTLEVDTEMMNEDSLLLDN